MQETGNKPERHTVTAWSGRDGQKSLGRRLATRYPYTMVLKGHTTVHKAASRKSKHWHNNTRLEKAALVG